MIIRSILFLALAVIATTAPIAVLFVCTVAYALYYTAFELIFLAVLLDGLYVGTISSQLPVYTLCVCCLVFFFEWIKPKIFMYN